MRAIVVVVVDEFGQNRSRMALADRNQVVKALPTGGPHPASAIEFARGA